MNGKPKKPLLLLFDGNAIVHRAYHALPPLTISKTGEMVNAVRGFASTLMKVIREVRPVYWGIAFDRPVPTFRHEKFAAYKEHRPRTPDELVSQIVRVHQVSEAFRIPVFEVDGYEADDVLGTLSRQASDQGIETVIVTGDNDMLQAVSPDVTVMAPRRGFGDTVIYDEEAVRQKYGISSRQLVDFKALVGDPSDNIPGVRGVGDKTATRLIQQFGNIEEKYARIDEVLPEKLRSKLAEYKERALQNKELVTIVTDVPVKLDPEASKVTAYDRNKVVELFRELEFVGLLSSLPGEIQRETETITRQSDQEVDYRIISTVAALDVLVSRLREAKEFAVDLETSSIDVINADIVSIALAMKEAEAFYIPVGHKALSNISQLFLDDVLVKLKPVLTDAAMHKAAQNAKFHMMALAGHGIKLEGLTFDTMIAAHLLGERTIGLKALAFNKLGIEMTPIEDLVGKGAKQISMALVDRKSVV
jgi:DNA polymerase-1